MMHQSRIGGMNHKLRHPLVGIQIPAHSDLQQIDRLLQIPAPIIPAMRTIHYHRHNLKFVALSPTTTHPVAARIIPLLSQFAMIGMMKMSGIN
jgi:hypothetical protein